MKGRSKLLNSKSTNSNPNPNQNLLSVMQNERFCRSCRKYSKLLLILEFSLIADQRLQEQAVISYPHNRCLTLVKNI